MTSSISDMFNILPPLSRQKNPNVAAVVGFITGGLGLGVYFQSFIDFVVPVVAVILLTAWSGPLGILGEAALAAAYGYARAITSNASLENQDGVEASVLRQAT